MGVRSPLAHESPGGVPIATEERYRPGSLADLIEMIIDGWQVDRLHYADDCAMCDGDPHVPAAFIELTRPDQGRYGICIHDDGKALSHRALISLFRECPHIWKHRSAARIHQMAADVPMATPYEQADWSEVVDPFPGALVFSPGTLRGVDAIDQTRSAGQITVALTTLERFRDGARLRFLIQAPEARKRRQLQVIGLEVTDDRGRVYTTVLLDENHDGSRLDGAFAIGPGIPSDAGDLSVRIAAIGDPKKESDATQGPWAFDVQVTHAVPAHA
ncbi:MAG: hypothetical protein FJW99_00900 [Actinobacteria bacterium]|nr:hypothetical protein [Actinomycetota bacterium]